MTGFVYAIDDGNGAVKIGWAGSPRRRLCEVNVGSAHDYTLVGYVSATREQEREFHALLRPWRVRGEWFRRVGPVEHFCQMLPKREPLGPPVSSEPITTVAQLIARWPSLSAFAEALNIKYVTAQQMKRRGRIDYKHWFKLITLPGPPITLEGLFALHGEVMPMREGAGA